MGGCHVGRESGGERGGTLYCDWLPKAVTFVHGGGGYLTHARRVFEAGASLLREITLHPNVTARYVFFTRRS